MIDLLINIFLHLDQNLISVVQEYGLWTYFILFAIIFFETGFVIFPFLPGDSLLFVGGAAAASGILEIPWLLLAIALGAVLGDTVNYWIGNYLGLHFFRERFPTLVKKEYIDRTYAFYERYGGATIFVARFVPVVRTFAPFLAGVGSMQYQRFLFYNVLGGISWAVALVMGGYFFGRLDVVKENMSLLLIGVILVTIATVIIIASSIAASYWERRKKGTIKK
jgi:membrane-associated protein